MYANILANDNWGKYANPGGWNGMFVSLSFYSLWQIRTCLRLGMIVSRWIKRKLSLHCGALQRYCFFILFWTPIIFALTLSGSSHPWPRHPRPKGVHPQHYHKQGADCCQPGSAWGTRHKTSRRRHLWHLGWRVIPQRYYLKRTNS
jgi:hypothetical protein